jgi:uncharacterized membrane protein YcaP (DUF421 family)
VEYLELSVSLPELALRGTVIYFVIAVVVRVLPKRTIGNNSPIDMLALITMGALVADAMSVGSQHPVDFLVLAGIVAAWDWVINIFEYRLPWLARITAEAPTPIVRNGVRIRRAMRRELITEDELMASVRHSGLERIEDVAIATVETTGDITVIPKPGTTSEQQDAGSTPAAVTTTEPTCR